MTIEARLHRAADALATLTNGRQTWHTDMPLDVDPAARAPDPHDLLDSALAACTTLTLELYIRRKQLAVTDLHVTVSHIEGRTADGRVDYQLDRRIEVGGELSDAERQRLVQIAERCPIHRILTGQIAIRTALA